MLYLDSDLANHFGTAVCSIKDLLVPYVPLVRKNEHANHQNIPFHKVIIVSSVAAMNTSTQQKYYLSGESP